MPTIRRSDNFSKKLVAWYKKHARDLPWRKTSDPYKIWISEVMLQQTTVKAVIPYYERWTRTFPTVHTVAKAPLQKILHAWQGLGYYQRAKNIHKSAKIIAQGEGRLPDDPEKLKKLPGFGPYTTGAVASIAFDKPFPIIDANVRRVIMRLLGIRGFAVTTHDPQILRFLTSVMPQKGAGDFNQALMELGALVCRVKEPLCNVCPVRAQCRAYRQGLQEIIPTPKKKTIKDINVVIALLQREGTYFIQKRPPKGLFADLWEFPGGKIRDGERPREALARELKEELQVSLESSRHAFKVRQFYTEFRAQLDVWFCEVRPDPVLDRTHRWVKKNDLRKYPMPSGSARIVDRLIE
jgi:A/G-specific adenine glycosylase